MQFQDETRILVLENIAIVRLVSSQPSEKIQKLMKENQWLRKDKYTNEQGREFDILYIDAPCQGERGRPSHLQIFFCGLISDGHMTVQFRQAGRKIKKSSIERFLFTK